MKQADLSSSTDGQKNTQYLLRSVCIIYTPIQYKIQFLIIGKQIESVKNVKRFKLLLFNLFLQAEWEQIFS